MQFLIMNLLDFYKFTVISNKKQTGQMCKIKQCTTCCTPSYIGKTYRHFKVRVSEDQGVFPGKPEQVNQLKVPCQPLLEITCLFMTIK